MELWQALLIGALQGVSELFPVSSLAHTILLPALLRWGIDQEAGNFLAFVVALHFATAIALVIFFWREWLQVVRAIFGSLQRRKLVYDDHSKFAWLLVAGTIPVGIIGLVFEKPLSKFFEDPKLFWVVAVFLILNGGVMLFGEFLRKRAEAYELQEIRNEPTYVGGAPGIESYRSTEKQIKLKNAEQLSFPQGGGVGASQALALLPGISRSGATIVGGLLAGLSHEQAARFAFMLATPVIGLAALLKIPSLLKPEARDILGMTIPSAIVAGILAYISVRFLMRYFETKRLSPFGYYCMWFGALSLIVLVIRGV